MSNGELLVSFRSGSGKTTADANIAVMISSRKDKSFADACFPFDTTHNGEKELLWSAYASELEMGEI